MLSALHELKKPNSRLILRKDAAMREIKSPTLSLGVVEQVSPRPPHHHHHHHHHHHPHSFFPTLRPCTCSRSRSTLSHTRILGTSRCAAETEPHSLALEHTPSGSLTTCSSGGCLARLSSTASIYPSYLLPWSHQRPTTPLSMLRSARLRALSFSGRYYLLPFDLCNASNSSVE